MGEILKQAYPIGPAAKAADKRLTDLRLRALRGEIAQAKKDNQVKKLERTLARTNAPKRLRA